MIIGITGKIGSGKTTLANYLVKSHNYTEYSMASPIKSIAQIFGYTHDQLNGSQQQKLEIHEHWGISGREFLQKVGTELFRDKIKEVLPNMKSVWVDLFRLQYEKEPKAYVISDIRFVDEANIIKQLGGIIIKVVRNSDVSSATRIEHVHKSELEMDSIPIDITIDNNRLGKEDIKKDIDNFLNIFWKIQNQIDVSNEERLLIRK